MEPHKQVIFDEETAVDDLTTATFCNKTLINKTLFEINKDAQNTLKPPQKPQKAVTRKIFILPIWTKKSEQTTPFCVRKGRLTPQHCQCILETTEYKYVFRQVVFF